MGIMSANAVAIRHRERPEGLCRRAGRRASRSIPAGELTQVRTRGCRIEAFSRAPRLQGLDSRDRLGRLRNHRKCLEVLLDAAPKWRELLDVTERTISAPTRRQREYPPWRPSWWERPLLPE